MDTIFPEHEKTINQVFEGIDPSDIEALINTAKKVGYQAQNH